MIGTILHSLAAGADGSKAHPFHYRLDGSSFLLTYLVPAVLSLVVAGGAAFVGHRLTRRRDDIAASEAARQAARAARMVNNDRITRGRVALALARRQAQALADLPSTRELPRLEPFDASTVVVSAAVASWSAEAVSALLDCLADLAQAVAAYRAAPTRARMANVVDRSAATAATLQRAEGDLAKRYRRGVEDLNSIDLHG